ncbi:MAG: GDP-mannose 4,6-dehydratase [Marinicellaceae bacterium]
MSQKTALITGVTGQDGALLSHYLLKQGYKIIAPTRKNPKTSKLQSLGVDLNHNITFIEYNKWSDFLDIIKLHEPDEVYHLAAMSHVGDSHKNPEKVFDVNTTWTITLLSAVAKQKKKIKFFFASSCEIFQNNLTKKVSEEDLMRPDNPYGISKLSAHTMVEYFRNIKGVFACNGILFNHESEIRDDNFVSKKICSEVARIVKNAGKPLCLGNIEAKKDWGYAPDYVKAFHSMLLQNKPDDYIISTGVLHSVKDMVDCAFKALDYPISWQGKGLETKAQNQAGEIVVAINEKYFRPLDNRFLIGNNEKAKKDLKFNNTTPFAQWVKSMTLEEYNKLK